MFDYHRIVTKRNLMLSNKSRDLRDGDEDGDVRYKKPEYEQDKLGIWREAEARE